PTSLRQSADRALKLSEDRAADGGWLHALRDVCANCQHIVAVASPEDRILEIVVNSRDLRDRDPHAAAGRAGEIGESIQVGTLGRSGRRHDRNEVDALAVFGDLVAGKERLQGERDFLRREPEGARTLLTNLEPDHFRLLVPVKLHVTRVRILPHDLAYLRADL